jgi:hypothetical protein
MIPSFYVEVDYIIVVRHHAMSQQLFSSNYRQLGIALPMILAEEGSSSRNLLAGVCHFLPVDFYQ